MTSNFEMIAKVLATENIQVVKAKVSTASFDVVNRTLYLPNWENLGPVVEDMLVCHEVGHALFTPTDFVDRVKANPKIKSYLNILEDARIEKLFKERFNGARKSFIQGYKEITEQDFFGLEGRNVNALNFIDRINVFFKLGALSGVKFSRTERPLVERAARTQTWEEVVALAEEIYGEAVRQKEQEQADVASITEQMAGEIQEAEDEYSSEFDDFDDDDFDFEDGDAEGEDDETSEEEKESSADGEGDGDEESDEENTDSEKESDESGIDDSFDSSLDSETDKSLKQKIAQAADFDTTVEYVEIDEEYDDDLVVSYKDIIKRIEIYSYSHTMENAKTAANDFKKRVQKQVGHMVQQFELRKAADIYARRRTAKSGLINVNKLATYKVKDEIFKKNIITPDGQNHGMIMLLDWSGSMQGSRLKHSLEQVQQLVMFCRKTSIPFEVYAFSNGSRVRTDRPKTNSNNKGDNFVLLQLFSNKMSLSDYNKMSGYVEYGILTSCYGLGSTPLTPAVFAMRKYIPKFQEENGVDKVSLLTFTDGANTVNIVSPAGDVTYLKDPVTKKNYKTWEREQDGSYYITELNAAYRMLKDRFNINSLSFFITPVNQYDIRNSIYYSGDAAKQFDYEYADKVRATVMSKGFFEYNGYGRDAIYIIDQRIMKNEEFSTDGITSDMTAARVASALKRTSKKSVKGKVLIEKFIEIIA